MEKQRKLKYNEIVTQGDLVKVKTLAEHEMESGVRRDEKTGVIYIKTAILAKKILSAKTGLISKTSFSSQKNR